MMESVQGLTGVHGLPLEAQSGASGWFSTSDSGGFSVWVNISFFSVVSGLFTGMAHCFVAAPSGVEPREVI